MTRPARSAAWRWSIFGGICLGVILMLWGFGALLDSAGVGPVHKSTIDQVPKFLTEETALTKAREAMAQERYDMSAWLPQENEGTKAPDGRPDLYFSRNMINPNNGCIVFRDQTGRDKNPSRVVDINLVGNELRCRVIYPH